MDKNAVLNIVRSTAGTVGIDPNLAQAIAEVESSLDPTVARYEKNFPYILTPDKFAKTLNISTETEHEFQKFSWGVMQLMGVCARELGFQSMLPLLIQPSLGALYGCRKLHAVMKKNPKLEDAISAYNAGTAVIKNGRYINQEYVDKVMEKLVRIKRTK